MQSSFITEDRKTRNMLSFFSVWSVQLDNRKGVYNLWAFYLHTALLHQAFAHCGKSPYYRSQMYCLGKKKHGQEEEEEEEHVSLHQESVCHTTWLSKVGQL
jgi:hypothetical protein